MTIASNLTTIIVTGTYTDIFGNPLNGSVSFAPAQVVTDTSGKTIFGSNSVTVKLDRMGRFSAVLPCTDNSNLSPVNFTYSFSENITGASRNFLISLPSTLGSKVDISSITPVVFIDAPSSYVLSSEVGAANGVAELDSHGLVPLTEIPPLPQYLPLTGGTMTGTITLAADPSLPLQTATKHYVDSSTLPPSGPASGDLSGAYPNPTVISTHLSSALPVNQGGTGQVTQQAAINNLTGTQSSGKYLRSDGINASLTNIQTGDVPILNQNTTGTASNITGTLDTVPAPVANVSMNSHKITSLTNGSSASDAAAFGQIPTSASTIGGLLASNNLSDVSVRQTALNNIAGAVTNAQYLRGNGSNISMSAIQATDLPAGTTSTQGALRLDGTAGDIQPIGTSAAAGSIGLAADSGHIHAWPYAVSAGFTPANPSSTTSTTLVMMGIGSTCSYTPVKSGKVMITLTGYMQIATAVQTCQVGGRYGTGTAPTNGTAVTGTRWGAVGDPSLRPPSVGGPTVVSFTSLITGLVPSTTYWFDLALGCSGGAGADAVQIQNISVVIMEVP